VASIECRVLLTGSDFVMQNHRVHGVSVMPGVTFLDILYRTLRQSGGDHRRAVLRDVLFPQPVVTTDGFDREISLTVGEPSAGAQEVRAESRWVRDGRPCSDWSEHLRGQLTFGDDGLPGPVDLEALKADATRVGDMEELYARARQEGIRHGTAMRCFGRLYRGPQYLLAEMRLDPSSRDHEERFHLHPAKLDASTLVGFGQIDTGEQPFVPMFIRSFRAPGQLPASCYVLAPLREVLGPSGDVIANDYGIYDEDGRCLAAFQGLTCKRIRFPALIQRLLDEVERPVPVSPASATPPRPEPEPEAVAGPPDVERQLRAMVARRLGRPAAEVPTNVGFYDLGLDSVALLELRGELEGLLGVELYPTLLFEFTDVGSLAAQLAAEHGDRLPRASGEAGLEAVCYRPTWAPATAVSRPAGDLLVVGAGRELRDLLRARLGPRHRLVDVEPGPELEVVGETSYRVDLQDREQVGRLLRTIEGATGLPADLVVTGDAWGGRLAGGALALWTLAAALVEARLAGSRRLTFVHAATEAGPRPELAAVGALARTLSAETPELTCRCVQLDAAELLLSVVADDSPEPEVRYEAGARLVRRWAPCEPAPPGAPVPIRDGGVYLISGGAGRLASAVAGHLAGAYGARLVLVGRRPQPDGLRDLVYVQADVSSAAGAAEAAEVARRTFGRIDGVFHCAGETRDAVFFRKRREDFEAVLAGKVLGAVHLDAATAGDDLDLFAMFSSVAAVVANPGQCDYAFANAFLDHFAEWRAARVDRAGRSLSIGWPLWAGGGMGMAPELVERSAGATGLRPLPTATGLDLLLRALAGPHQRLAVLYGEPERTARLLARPAPEPAPAPAARPEQEVAVAIVGLAGRYPQARDLDAFWRNLAGGRDCITEVPPERWDHDVLFDPMKGRPGKTYARWGGFLDGVDRFDPAFFGISRRDAERMDPQERLFLQTCWHALEDAGYPPDALAGSSVGVFVGVMWSHYQLVTDEDGVAPASLHAAVANRVSYCFGFDGPSLAVDTACSSSLTAIHLAVESLRLGECALALAGGVNVTVHPQKYLQLAQGQFLSTDGRCRSFGGGGDGYTPGEGVGAVLLKPLALARADGDHVYGVIRSSCVNHTGRTSGITVPSPVSQAALIRRAVERAGWDPSTIGYLEAHGTGTALGDPIEVEGMRRAFAGGPLSDGACAIGSVKSNIGHLEAAAGIAAVTKVLLQLRHRQLVPSLHSREPNPHVELEASPFRVQQELAPWPRPAGAPRRAGISAFGAGGANAHLLLEEEEEAPARPDADGGPCLFVLSARDETALRDYAGSLAAHLEPGPGPGADLDDLTYTLQVGRAVMAARLAIVANDHAELRSRLAAFLRGDPPGGDVLWRPRAPAEAEVPAPADAVGLFRAGRLHELAAYWVAGGDVPWRACHPRPGAGRPPRRVPLPTYPFQEERCWIGAWKRSDAASKAPSPLDFRVLDQGIALIVMRDRMFTDALLSGLRSALDEVANRPDVRAVVVSGTGDVFSMGATPEALEKLAARQASFTDVPFLYEGMLRCPRPVVAAIQGHAFGGGLAFGLYADIAVLAREASYSASFVRLGFTPGMGATHVLEQRLGTSLAAEMLLTGRSLTGEELRRRGVSLAVLPRDEVLPAALELARSIADRPPDAIGALKQELAGRVLDRLPEIVAREAEIHQRVLGGEAVRRVRERFAGPAPEPAAVPEAALDEAEVRRAVEERLEGALYLERREIDPDLSFSDMGLDSIGAVEVVRDLNHRFGLDLDTTAVYEHPSVSRLVAFVARTRRAGQALRQQAMGSPCDVGARLASPAGPSGPEQTAADAAAGDASVAPTSSQVVTLSPLARPAPRGRAGDVAVIGMWGRFPDAPDPEAFWANLAAGRCSVREVPAERWRGADGQVGAWLSGVDEFEPELFNLSPLDAESMDPQQRLFLEAAWCALEDAGYGGRASEPRRFGVFVGTGSGDYLRLLQAAGQGDTAQAFLGSSSSLLPSRIAYVLDLRGPTVAIDTACSSSLVAVHLACEAVLAGQCEAALAGGVAVMCTPQMHLWTGSAGMLSPTGTCAPFAASADGIVLGEGVGVVVLKRLDRALADRDHVHGVIRASGTNGDGRTNGITAPSATAQEELLVAVHERAGIRPEDLGYVEAHGTATRLGDPIEVGALTRAFRRGTSRRGYCGIGSLKGNIGHTTMAAGVAGLMKVLMALRHRELPPSLHCREPNPAIDFEGSPFFVVGERRTWEPGPDGRRTAAVSSFGFSGTNCHLVVEEPPEAAPAAEGDAYALVPISARTEEALARRLEDLAGRLEPGAGPWDVAFTLGVGRAHLPVRTALVVGRREDLAARLSAALEERRAGGRPAADGLAEGWDREPLALLRRAREAGDEPLLRSALEALAAGYERGGDLDWASVYRGRDGRRIELPVYPFSRRRYWVSAAGEEGDQGPTILVPTWREVPPAGAKPEPGRRAALLHSGGKDPLVPALRAVHAGDDVIAMPLDEAPRALAAGGAPLDVVTVLATAADPAAPPELDASTLGAFRLVKALIAAGHDRRPLTLRLVVAGAVPVADGEPVWPHAAGLVGLAGAVAAEHPRWSVGCIDVGAGPLDHADLARRIRAEPCEHRLVALRGERRLVRDLAPAPGLRSRPTPFRADGNYLVLGGAGGIGSILSRHLAATVRARVAWVGRRPPSQEILARIAEIESLGGHAVYLQADAADPVALRRAVTDIRARLGPIHGVFHAALVLRDRRLADLDEADLTDVLAPKVAGSAALAAALGDESPDFLAFFSSAASFTDSGGQGNYAAASTFEDAFALSLRQQGLPACVVNWGWWGSVGAVAGPEYAARFAALGIRSIQPAEGMEALEQVLANGIGQALVVSGEPEGLARLGARGAGAGEGSLTRSRSGFAELEALARNRLRRRLLALDGFPRPEERVPRAELRRRLGVVPEQERLFDAALEILQSAAGGVPVEEADLVRRFPDLAPHVRLLETCLAALPEVLAGTRNATEVLFPRGSTALVGPIYRGQAAADHYSRLMAAEVAEALRRIRGRPASLLEVGAGTGGSTAFVLEACSATEPAPRYLYTDVSTAFLRHGEQRFAASFPFVSFRTLDVERDPVEQGVEPESQDVVLAANVLHATASVEQTLHHLGRLLRPGGLLLVNEVTRASDFLTCTFGLTAGWWRARDPERRLPHSPLLSPVQWREAMVAAGLRPLAVRGIPGTPADDLEQCLLVAERPAPSQPDRPALQRAGTAYVTAVFSEVLKFPEADLDPDATFETFGVDSLVGLHIVDRLERDLGPLPATLLFDHLTIDRLAAHLVTERGERLARLVRMEPVPSEPAERRVAPPRPAAATDVAVVGVGGRYPGSPDLHAFWANLAGGASCLTEVPADRWDWRRHFDPRRGGRQRSYSRWGGFLEGVDLFDAGFFGILPAEAAGIDPQERLFLETTWNLLESAGYLGTSTREPLTGVFVGTMYGSYGQLAAATGWPRGDLAAARCAYWSIANRVSYFFDLQGPSFAVDSACSSSLTAVHLACESIRRGECRMAIAGGVNVILHPAHLVSLCAMNMLSGDGECRVFDERADGFVPGEGVGAVLLKPLAAAEADGDRIWGVIKGGFANAGGKTGGYTVPNPSAQATLVERALERSGVDPRTITYVEAHGTGTSLGDPIEIAGLSRAFGERGSRGGRCAVGSVKANIGHLEGAAGIAGLTKVLLQMRHGQLAPCASLETVNPKIDFGSWPFEPVRELVEWPRPALAGEGGEPRVLPRRAGVSSFGAGGANVHLVVEEHLGSAGAAASSADEAGGEQLFLLSARNPGQLRALAGRVAESIGDAGVSLPQLAYTSQVGRAEMPERLAVVAGSAAELADRLRGFSRGDGAGVLAGSAADAGARGLLSDREGTAFVDELLAARRLARLAQAWTEGVAVDWSRLWASGHPPRADLPEYPFERRRYWLPEGDSAPANEERAVEECRYYRPVWEEAP
jgi:acyl transferase domain-containing protein/enoyl-CoA hydratase/carnithine racemase/acyl carrier protein/SAM-dependent methyltransferase